MTSAVFEFKVIFDVSLDGEQAYVTERVNGELPGATMYGPMPRDFTGPFIDERKEFWSDYLKNHIACLKERR